MRPPWNGATPWPQPDFTTWSRTAHGSVSTWWAVTGTLPVSRQEMMAPPRLPLAPKVEFGCASSCGVLPSQVGRSW